MNDDFLRAFVNLRSGCVDKFIIIQIGLISGGKVLLINVNTQAVYYYSNVLNTEMSSFQKVRVL